MALSKISAKVRASAIADLMDGEQPAIVAEKYGIDAAKVRVWKQRYVTPDVTENITPGVTNGRPVYVQSPQRDRAQLAIAELVMENLRAKLIATQRIVEYASNNPAWLEKQTAADVGELFERIDRSSIAILDRMATAGRPAAGGGGDDPLRAD